RANGSGLAHPSTQTPLLRRLEIRSRSLPPFANGSQRDVPHGWHAARSATRRLQSKAQSTARQENASSIRADLPVSRDNQIHARSSYRKKSATRRQPPHFSFLQNTERQPQPPM